MCALIRHCGKWELLLTGTKSAKNTSQKHLDGDPQNSVQLRRHSPYQVARIQEVECVTWWIGGLCLEVGLTSSLMHALSHRKPLFSPFDKYSIALEDYYAYH